MMIWLIYQVVRQRCDDVPCKMITLHNLLTINIKYKDIDIKSQSWYKPLYRLYATETVHRIHSRHPIDIRTLLDASRQAKEMLIADEFDIHIRSYFRTDVPDYILAYHILGRKYVQFGVFQRGDEYIYVLVHDNKHYTLGDFSTPVPDTYIFTPLDPSTFIDRMYSRYSIPTDCFPDVDVLRQVRYLARKAL